MYDRNLFTPREAVRVRSRKKPDSLHTDGPHDTSLDDVRALQRIPSESSRAKARVAKPHPRRATEARRVASRVLLGQDDFGGVKIGWPPSDCPREEFGGID